LWWYHMGNRAIRVGDWKLVAEGAADPWELYDMRTDRSESNNLADQQPEKVRELSERWTRMAEEFRRLATGDGAKSGG
ncbi:MAG: arylsulfatase, partial [Phycisphaerae bacterium]